MAVFKTRFGSLVALLGMWLVACSRSQPAEGRTGASGSERGPAESPKTRVEQRLQLSAARHGLQGEVQLLVDQRLASAEFESGDGYAAEEATILRAVLRLVADSGQVRDELRLHPVADVRMQQFGDTDALLVTEHVRCEAGRFCGWPTRLFGIGGGRFTALRALGAAGNERNIEVMASFASRWAILPRSASGASELVSQAEDSASGAWVERRYFYEAGRWRYSERQAPAGDVAFAATPGNWRGALD